MTVLTVPGARHVQVDAVTPAAQASVDALTVLAGSAIDARAWRSVAYTIAVITDSVDWTVFGANAADYSDEAVVQAAAAVAAAATGSYAVAQAPYGHYRVKIASTAAGVPGTATVRGIAKG